VKSTVKMFGKMRREGVHQAIGLVRRGQREGKEGGVHAGVSLRYEPGLFELKKRARRHEGRGN